MKKTDQNDLKIESPSRRAMLKIGAGGIALAALSSFKAAHGEQQRGISAIAFDGIALFDIRPTAALAEELFPGRGMEFTNAWRTRQFEYTWLRTVMNDYADFRKVSEDALIFSARLLKLDLTSEKRERMMGSLYKIKAWPDVLPVLRALKERGIKMTLLSNFTTEMLETATRNSGLEAYLEAPLSTDIVKAYKPDTRAYQMAVDAFKLPKEEIAFVAFAGWDAAGAKQFGYRTYWADRLGLPAEELGTPVDFTSNSLADLDKFCREGS